jgi:hypothetical protein
MKLYPETPGRRFGQVLIDLVVLAWVAAWALAGREVHRLIEQMAKPGVAVEQAGDRVASSMGAVQDQVTRLPVIGNDLRAPFGRLGEAGQALAQAGASQQHVVHQLALWLGVLIALIPVVVVVAIWLPGRVRWVREASAASRLRVGADTVDLGLFALRAIATRPLPELRRASADPLGDLQRGDYRALATLELRSLGLRPDAPGLARRRRRARGRA